MQILNISKLRNGIGILKKQENITENLTAEENRKEITETMENAAAEKKPARRPARKNTTARKKKTDEAAGKEEKGGKAEKKARAEKKTKSASAETVKVKKSGKNKQQEILSKDLSELSPLSHLVLVVDEFTELKRFSSESNDVDFIAEITTIARVGRTLGFHIILVSQNIEGAITDDIRVNSKARICLKVATKQASKEMIGTPAAAAPTMPLNGRAYLLVGTGTRFEYFQSAYTGANKNLNIDPAVIVTQATNSGKFNNGFYSSKKDNIIEKKRSENVSEHDTQLAYVVKTIIEIGKNMEKPRQIFLPPLPGVITDKTDWEGLS